MSRFIVNLQGSLANPNLALKAAKRGALASLGAGPTARIDERAIADALASGVCATCVTVGHVLGPAEPVQTTLADIAAWRDFAAREDSPFTIVHTETQLQDCATLGKIGVILGFQNTAMLRGNPGAVAEFAREGVGVIQLTYNDANDIGTGCLGPSDRGLTGLGREVVAALNECGVLVDLSHSNAATLRDAVKTSCKPVAVSHTACGSLVNNPRNVTDEDLRLLAHNGGVAGIFAMPFLRDCGQPHLDDYVRHIEHALNVVGADHVALGTDGTITQVDDVQTYLHYLGEAVQSRKAAGVAAPGEDGAIALFLPDMTGPSQFEKLALRLAQRRHPESTIDKVLGLNWRRLLAEVWPSQLVARAG